MKTTIEALMKAWALNKSDKQVLQVVRDALIETIPDGVDSAKWLHQQLGEMNYRWKVLTELRERLARYEREDFDTSTAGEWRLARAVRDVVSDTGLVRLSQGEVTIARLGAPTTISYLCYRLYRVQLADAHHFEFIDGEVAEDARVPFKGTPPKIELKKFTANQRLSEETLAFHADVYVDGKKAGTVSNHGQGGSCDVHFFAVTVRERVEAWLSTLISVSPFDEHGQPCEESGEVPEAYEMTEDSFFGDLAEAELKKKDDARIAKRLQKDAEKVRAQGLTPMKFTLRDARGTSFVVMGLKAGEHPTSVANLLTKRFKAEVLASEAM